MRFENDVKMYGTQAVWRRLMQIVPFENDVKMYGTQATLEDVIDKQVENDVKNVWYTS